MAVGRILVPHPPEGSGFPDAIEGKARIPPGFRQPFANLESYDYEVREIYPTVDPDAAIVEWRVEAKIKSTSWEYRGGNITVFKFCDARISECHDYFDSQRFRVVVEELAKTDT